MKHTAEDMTCPIVAEPNNFHFEMRCEDCDIAYHIGRTPAEVTNRYHQGRVTQDEFEGYCLAWDLLSPYRDPHAVEISQFPAVRRIARKLIRARGFDVPAQLKEAVTA